MLADRARLVSSASVIALSQTDWAENNTSQTTFTFTDRSIGTASSDRTVVVGVFAEGSASRTISSMTIGGSAGTIVGTLQESTGGQYCAMYRRDVTSGTTATIAITWSGAMSRGSVIIYTLAGHSSAIPAAFNATTATDGTLEFTLAPSANNATIAFACSSTVGLWNSLSWTVITEDVDELLGPTNIVYGSASESPDDGTANPVCTSWEGTRKMAGVAATWA